MTNYSTNKTLTKFIDYQTKSLPIMNEFNGLYGKEKYDTLILRGRFCIHNFIRVRFVVTRGLASDLYNSITFTKLRTKQHPYRRLISYLESEISRETAEQYAMKSKLFKLEVPYVLEAQDQSILDNYGKYYQYGELIYDGNNWGDTNSYLITGIYFDI